MTAPRPEGNGPAVETAGMIAQDRSVLRISGNDARTFLQGLVTNDVDGLDRGAVYAALLSPRGKYLFDFFLLADGADILVDIKADRADAFAQRLAMYRLRAAITIAPTGLVVAQGIGAPPAVAQGIGAPPAMAFPDPRDPALGWRAICADPGALLASARALDPGEFTALRVAHGVPETGIELIPDESYILEMGFDRLRGVDFRKGCYVGQEITARMKHKTELRKGLVQVEIEGPPPPPGTEILGDGKPAGTLHSIAGTSGLAYLRFDRASDDLTTGEARIRLRATPP